MAPRAARPPSAQARAATGYSGTPLAKKLGLREGHTVRWVAAPPELPQWLAPLPARRGVAPRLGIEVDLVHGFYTERARLARHLADCRARLREDAVLWVSWPKKSAKVATDITEDVIRELALPLGFVDIKVCAVSEVWSGVQRVLRKELRQGGR